MTLKFRSASAEGYDRRRASHPRGQQRLHQCMPGVDGLAGLAVWNHHAERIEARRGEAVHCGVPIQGTNDRVGDHRGASGREHCSNSSPESLQPAIDDVDWVCTISELNGQNHPCSPPPAAAITHLATRSGVSPSTRT